MRFRPSAPLQEDTLRALPEVTTATWHGPQVEITGTGNLVGAVTSLLARRQIIAADLRVDQATLDDAFIALTGRAHAAPPAEGTPTPPAAR